MEDSVNISATTIKGLLKLNNSLFLISTHLNELKNLEEVHNKKVSTFFINCELQNNIPRFDYTIKEGWSEIKVGSILFNIEGLNDLLK
jgi:DNA mismatch repair protein MutS